MSGGFSNKQEFSDELTADELLWVQTAEDGVLLMRETAAPSHTSGFGKLYVKSSDSLLYFKDDSGNEYSLTTGSIDGSGNANELTYWVDSDTLGSLAVATYPSLTEISYVKGVTSAIQTQFTGKANTTLNNLGSVAINTSLVSDTDSTDDLGSTLIAWRNLYVDKVLSIAGTTLNIETPSGVTASGMNITTGSASGDGNAGGGMTFTSGDGTGAGNGGDINFQAGSGGTTGPGGGFSMSAGNGGDSGGSFTLSAGSGNAGNAAGGSVNFVTGSRSGSGAYGKFTFLNIQADDVGILDFSNITVSAKTYTFPDASGTIALTSNIPDALTDFTANGNWKVFYSDGSGDVQELSLGADGTFLKSNGAAAAPTFATPTGTGDVVKVGTPVNNQIGVWTGDGTLEGDADLTFDTTTNTLATTDISLANDLLFPNANSLINWGSGDITLLYETNVLTLSGGSLILASGGNLTLSSGDLTVVGAIQVGHASDTTLARVSAGVISVEGKTIVNLTDGGTFLADISVPDEAYGVGWNGSVEVPTKNAVYDKIETLVAGSGISEELAIAYATVLQ